MGNSVCSDSSLLTIDELIKAAKTYSRGPLPSERFGGFQHNVRGFEFSLSGGSGRAAVQCAGISPAAIFKESSSVVVLHVQRTSTATLCPPTGANYPPPSAEAATFARKCEEAFTPRGTASMFAVDVTALKWRLKAHKGDFVHSYKLYVYNGNCAPPLVSAVAVMNAFTLEQAIAGKADLVEGLFYNALTSKCPAPVHVDAVVETTLNEEETLNLYRDHAFLRAMSNVLTPSSTNQYVSPGSPNRNRVSPTKGSNLPRLVLRSDIEADDTAPPAIHRFQTDPQPAAPIAAPSMNLALDTAAANDEVEDYNDDRQARLKELMPIASEILPYLFVGGEKAAEDKRQLLEKGITFVVNAAAVAIGCPFESEFEYLPLYLCDTPDEDIESLFPLVIQCIENVRASGGKVFVHCHQGVSRSTTLVISYLMWKNGMCFEEALQFAKDRRSIVSPNTGFLVKLMRWERHLSSPADSQVWAYLPFTSQYPLPFAFKPVVPEDGHVVVDDRTCYGIAKRGDNGVLSVYFFGGQRCIADMKDDAAKILNDLRTYGYYSQPKIATSSATRGGQAMKLTFSPIVTNGDVIDISNDQTAADIISAALKAPVTISRNSKFDTFLVSDVQTVYAEMLRRRRAIAEGAGRRKNRRVEALKELDELDASAAAAKAKEEMNTCGVDSDEEDHSDHLSVFEYPFDGDAIEFIDREDLRSDGAYAIIIRGSKALNRPHQVFLWIGSEFSDADEDDIITTYDANLVETGAMISCKKALRNVAELVVHEGDEPEALLLMIE